MALAFNQAVQNAAVEERKLDPTASQQLNIYSTMNHTFGEFGGREGYAGAVTGPTAAPLAFSVLGTNPINNSVAPVDPGVVSSRRNVTSNLEVDTAMGDVVRQVPQVGRGYRNQTMSLPYNLPQRRLEVTNKRTIVNALAQKL